MMATMVLAVSWLLSILGSCVLAEALLAPFRTDPAPGEYRFPFIGWMLDLPSWIYRRLERMTSHKES